MALLTFDQHVFARQRELRFCVVKTRALPIAIAVAGFARSSQLAFVFVVLLVAAEALHRRRAKALQIFVTGVALQHVFAVCISQLKFGAVMVEAALGRLPISLAVAVATLSTQRAFVLIRLLVAGKALFGCVIEHRTAVAFFALGQCVFSQQGEAGLGMIELRRFFPAALGMAASTLLAQGVPVLVILLVAGVAVMAQLDLVKIASVASAAFGGPVLASQCVLGVRIVVEIGGLPRPGAVA